MKMKRSKAEKKTQIEKGKRPQSANRAIKRTDSINAICKKKKMDEGKLVALEMDIEGLLENRSGVEK